MYDFKPVMVFSTDRDQIKDLYPMMWKKAQALMDRLYLEIQEHPAKGGDINKSAISGTTEINNWASKVTLDIIGVSGLGREINALKNSDDQLVKDYEELLEPTSEKLLFFFMKAFVSARFTEMLPWKVNEDFARLTSSLRNICRQMVRDKRESVKSGEQHFDILSLLIKSNDFSDDELVDQLLTFLAAGYVCLSISGSIRLKNFQGMRPPRRLSLGPHFYWLPTKTCKLASAKKSAMRFQIIQLLIHHSIFLEF
jgi:hypothetical protein